MWPDDTTEQEKRDFREAGLWPQPPLNNLIQPRQFERNGMTVTEFILKVSSKGANEFRLVWVRHPLSTLEFDGRQNMFVHIDFGTEWLASREMEAGYDGLRKLEEAARRKVAEQFDRWWADQPILTASVQMSDGRPNP